MNQQVLERGAKVGMPMHKKCLTALKCNNDWVLTNGKNKRKLNPPKDLRC